MSERSAVISIGTNSTRYMIVDFSGKRFRFFGQPISRVVAQKSVGTRIGEGLRESGLLGDEPMRRTLEALAEHMRAIGAPAPPLSVIATSAMRRAQNGPAFLEKVSVLTGVIPTVLSGEEEARCSFRGAVMSVPHGESQRIGVFDTGGGSSEYALGDHDHADAAISFEIGAVRLTEDFPQLSGMQGDVQKKIVERARMVAREVMQPVCQFERVSELVCVGGSATATAALIRGHRGRFAHMAFTRKALQEQLARIVALSLKKRKKLPGMNNQRADILPAGMIILDTLFELLRHDSLTVSTTDLLYGYLLLEHEKSLNVPS